MSVEQATTVWSSDVALPGFEAATLHFPDDYEGPVVATLVRRKAAMPTRRAFLHVHGFVDYFFQAHLAEQCNAHGFNFYALDLRKYGRSLLPKQHPNFCKNITEYYADITAAIKIITGEEDNTYLAVSGHSTGGLIMSLYAAEGAEKARVDALFLNSPFFDFNLSPPLKAATAIAAQIGTLSPFMSLPEALSPLYAQSLHKDHYGEWQFDTRWKPIKGFPACFGWLHAIRTAQARLRKGLAITCPVLGMHSDKSIYGKKWDESFHTGDAVLSVDHIKRNSLHLGSNVTLVEIKDGLHDLTLSRQDVRNKVFEELFAWLQSIEQHAATTDNLVR